MLTDDKASVGYNARTDARFQIVSDNPWFTFPYPGEEFAHAQKQIKNALAAYDA